MSVLSKAIFISMNEWDNSKISREGKSWNGKPAVYLYLKNTDVPYGELCYINYAVFKNDIR